jgi:diguanylate cyclase (GGDEF)-like protein
MSLLRQIRVLCLPALILLLFRLPLAAQQYTFRQYGPSDGLTNLGINCLFQDHTGFLWVGTDNGLFRYDGSIFQSFGHAEGLEDTEIRSVTESPEGVLWVATQNGVARRNGRRFEPVNAGVSGLFLSLAFDSQGALYLEHRNGIVRGVKQPGGDYHFTLVAPGSAGGMLVHGSDVYFRRDGDLWRLRGGVTDRIGSPAGLPSDHWGSIAIDTHGDLWVRSATRLYELPSGQPRFLDRSEGIPNAGVDRVYADIHGRIYVSTISGVVVLDGPNHAQRTYIDSEHGLPSDVASSVLLDRGDSLWIGMRGGGLVRRLGHGEWLTWRKADGLLNDSTWAVLHDRNGRLWAGTNGGLSVFAPDGKLAHAWTQHNGLSGVGVYAIAAATSGEVFAGTAPAGITRFAPDGRLLHGYGQASGLVAEQVNTLAFDLDNRLWVAAAGGCFRSRAAANPGSDLKFDRISIPGIPRGAYYYDVKVDRGGVLWIASSSGLARFDGSVWKVFTKADGLKSDDLVSIAVGADEIWVAYRDALGIARLQVRGNKLQVTGFTQQNGLSSDLVYAIALDHKRRLWVSTDNGVVMYDPSLGDPAQWRHYGMEDGFAWDDGNDHALSVDQNDDVWVGTSRGLSRFAPSPYPIPDVASAVVLTSIQGVGQEYQAGDRPVLSRAQNSLIIQFSGLNFAEETRTRYRYRLLGSKSAWTDTRENSVHFEGLPGGSYVFEVIAAGPNGIWSPVPAQFAFKVKRPWWLSWWFIAACVLTVGLLASAFWRFRVRALVAQKEFLEQQVRDRTAELQESHRQLEEIAYYDVLTTLPNRRMFTEQCRSRLAISRRLGTPFALLLIDLDSFKQTNDSFGHDAGDAVLIGSSTLLKLAVRQSDCVARLGGDEFAILLISPLDPSGIEVVCARILKSLAAGIDFKDTMLKATCSIGVAVFPQDGDTQDRLYKAADLAMYEAKRLGGNRWSRYRPEMEGNQTETDRSQGQMRFSE